MVKSFYLKENTAGEEITLKFDTCMLDSRLHIPAKQNDESEFSSDTDDIPEDSNGVSLRLDQLNLQKLEIHSPFSSPKTSSRSANSRSRSSDRAESLQIDKSNSLPVKKSSFKLGRVTEPIGIDFRSFESVKFKELERQEVTPTFRQDYSQRKMNNSCNFVQMFAFDAQE